MPLCLLVDCIVRHVRVSSVVAKRGHGDIVGLLAVEKVSQEVKRLLGRMSGAAELPRLILQVTLSTQEQRLSIKSNLLGE